jgi:hypothetical protein
MKTTLANLLLPFAISIAAVAADPSDAILVGAVAPERQINVRIELQVVAIPEEVAIPLAADLLNKSKIEAANTKIQGLLAKGVAKLIAWPIITTKSGQRAVVESIDEFRYATDYEGPQAVSASTPEGTQPVKVDVTHLDASPTAFETRNTGVTLEVEPVLSKDGKKIDLNLVPQHVMLKGMNKITVEKPSLGKLVVEQPDFDTMKVTTSLTLRSGERILLGIFRPHEPAKHIEFFILKAEAIPVD